MCAAPPPIRLVPVLSSASNYMARESALAGATRLRSEIRAAFSPVLLALLGGDHAYEYPLSVISQKRSVA